MRRFGTSLQHAMRGLATTVRAERNLQIELGIAVLALLAGWWLPLTRLEWMVLCLTIGMVLMTELFNSAVEQLSNLYTREPNESVRRIKDMAAGAVLVVSLSSGGIGLLLFGPKLWAWLSSLL